MKHGDIRAESGVRQLHCVTGSVTRTYEREFETEVTNSARQELYLPAPGRSVAGSSKVHNCCHVSASA